jgi:hypothetical protein
MIDKVAMIKINTQQKHLILKLQHLIESDELKQRKYQQDQKTGPECGFFTKELLEIAKLLPQMNQLGITFDMIRNQDG